MAEVLADGYDFNKHEGLAGAIELADGVWRSQSAKALQSQCPLPGVGSLGGQAGTPVSSSHMPHPCGFSQCLEALVTGICRFCEGKRCVTMATSLPPCSNGKRRGKQG